MAELFDQSPRGFVLLFQDMHQSLAVFLRLTVGDGREEFRFFTDQVRFHLMRQLAKQFIHVVELGMAPSVGLEHVHNQFMRFRKRSPQIAVVLRQDKLHEPFGAHFGERLSGLFRTGGKLIQRFINIAVDKALFLDDFAEQTPTAATVVDARSTEYGGRQREIHHDVANGVFMPFILHNKPPMLWYGRTVAWGTEKTF